MGKFSLVCQECGYSWLSTTQIVSICPGCQKRTRIRAYSAKIGTFRLTCRSCGISWHDQQERAPCIQCGRFNTNSKAIWIRHNEAFTLPLRTPISPDLSTINGSAIGVDVFRLGCRVCDLYWLDAAREAPCPECGQKSTSSKSESISKAQIRQVAFRVPRPLPELTQLLHNSQIVQQNTICPNCGKASDPERENFCSNCGTSLTTSPGQFEAQSEFYEPTRAFCFQCGAEVSPSASFCQVCGSSMEDQ